MAPEDIIKAEIAETLINLSSQNDNSKENPQAVPYTETSKRVRTKPKKLLDYEINEEELKKSGRLEKVSFGKDKNESAKKSTPGKRGRPKKLIQDNSDNSSQTCSNAGNYMENQEKPSMEDYSIQSAGDCSIPHTRRRRHSSGFKLNIPLEQAANSFDTNEGISSNLVSNELVSTEISNKSNNENEQDGTSKNPMQHTDDTFIKRMSKTKSDARIPFIDQSGDGPFELAKTLNSNEHDNRKAKISKKLKRTLLDYSANKPINDEEESETINKRTSINSPNIAEKDSKARGRGRPKKHKDNEVSVTADRESMQTNSKKECSQISSNQNDKSLYISPDNEIVTKVKGPGRTKKLTTGKSPESENKTIAANKDFVELDQHDLLCKLGINKKGRHSASTLESDRIKETESNSSSPSSLNIISRSKRQEKFVHKDADDSVGDHTDEDIIHERFESEKDSSDSEVTFATPVRVTGGKRGSPRKRGRTMNTESNSSPSDADTSLSLTSTGSKTLSKPVLNESVSDPQDTNITHDGEHDDPHCENSFTVTSQSRGRTRGRPRGRPHGGGRGARIDSNSSSPSVVKTALLATSTGSKRQRKPVLRYIDESVSSPADSNIIHESDSCSENSFTTPGGASGKAHGRDRRPGESDFNSSVVDSSLTLSGSRTKRQRRSVQKYKDDASSEVDESLCELDESKDTNSDDEKYSDNQQEDNSLCKSTQMVSKDPSKSRGKGKGKGQAIGHREGHADVNNDKEEKKVRNCIVKSLHLLKKDS